MFTSIKTILNKIYDFIGSKEVVGFDDVYQEHVVNFSYLWFLFGNAVLSAVFLFYWNLSAFSFCFFCFVVTIKGLHYSYVGRVEKSQVLIVVLTIFEIVALNIFCFAATSLFHWLFINTVLYCVVIFRADKKVMRNAFIFVCCLLFIAFEIVRLRSFEALLSSRYFFSFFVFSSIVFYVSMVSHLVMTRLKSINNELRSLAEQDELTGLPNRRKVLADAVNVFADAIISRTKCVFVIIDLDHFKKINDTYGHEAGDLVLSQVANGMRSKIRPSDKIGRYGGEEFIVIMSNTSLQDAEIMIEELRQFVEDMLIETDMGIVIPVTISAGVAVIKPEVSRYEEILAAADEALYVAKRNGRNRVFAELGQSN